MVRRSILRESGAKLVPWAVLGVGLTTTFILYGSIGRNRESRNQREFKRSIGRLSNEIDGAVRQQIAILNATAGVAAADPSIGRKEFRTYYQNLSRGGPAQIPLSIGLSLSRPWERRQELAEEAQKRGVPNFVLRPDTPRPEAHAIILIEPFTGANLDAPGFDMHAEPVRRKEMDAARDTGKPRLTPKVVLSQDRGQPVPAFLLYLPVYRVEAPASQTARRESLIGILYSSLRARNLFRELTIRLDDEKVGLRLWSGPQTEDNLVFQHGVDLRPQRGTTVRLQPGDAGQEFEAEFLAHSDFAVSAAVQPFVLPVGVAVSLLLFALASALGRAQEQASRRESEQWLLAEVGRLTASATENHTVLSEIARAIGNTLHVVCRIDVLDIDGTLRSVDTRSTPSSALAELERDYPRLESDALLATALKTGQTQLADGYLAKDQTHQALIDNLGVGPVVIVPMRLRDEAVGAITLTRPKGQLPLKGDAVALTEALAGRIGLAIDNARLYEAAQRENDELERRVAERTRDLEASTHELESFCYSVSHDLRTPLRSLDGFSRALREDYGDRLDEQGLDYIERIRASTKRMDELITALLTLSRLTRREILPSLVDVTGLVRDMHHDLDPGGQVLLEVDEGLQAHADPRMLTIVFENLLSNAIKFSSRTKEPKVVVGRAADGSIYVRDNGAGFDPQYSNKLFQPFERLHSVREFPGHGIGLATVERIVRRHGGEVRAEGQPGIGATFFVRFP